MQVEASNTTTAVTQTASSTKSSTGSTLDYNNFLRLLVAQMRNQDPTAPSDPTAFVSQLASFSAVEQQVNMNSKLDALLTQTELSQGASVIGRTLTSADGTISGKVGAIEITSSGATALLTNGQTIALGAGVIVS
jgi:flagellar basal-body rod modification protein FlgD